MELLRYSVVARVGVGDQRAGRAAEQFIGFHASLGMDHQEAGAGGGKRPQPVTAGAAKVSGFIGIGEALSPHVFANGAVAYFGEGDRAFRPS